MRLTWAVRLLAGEAEDLSAEVLPLVRGQVLVAGQEAAGLKVAECRVKGPERTTWWGAAHTAPSPRGLPVWCLHLGDKHKCDSAL